MYARQGPQGRFPRNVRIPQNYSGNAFREEEPIAVLEESPPSDPSPSNQDSAEAPLVSADSEPVGKLFPSPGFQFSLGKLFGKDRGLGIGTEELLIIGLILLLSQGDGSDDLILLLLLLLFIQ